MQQRLPFYRRYHARVHEISYESTSLWQHGDICDTLISEAAGALLRARPNSLGEVMVQLVAGSVDYGDAAEVYVSRVTRISRISSNIVRITYCVEREGPHGIERRVVIHLLRDLEELAAEVERVRQGIEIARGEPPLNRDASLRIEWH